MLSVVVGLLMIVLFGYTSDQKAIGIAKDQLKAHLLAVRLYRDQLHVVMGSYGKVLRGTGRYLKLAFKPLLYVIIPITLLIVQLDRYLGLTAIQTNTPFLLTAHVNNAAGAGWNFDRSAAGNYRERPSGAYCRRQRSRLEARGQPAKAHTR